MREEELRKVMRKVNPYGYRIRTGIIAENAQLIEQIFETAKKLQPVNETWGSDNRFLWIRTSDTEQQWHGLCLADHEGYKSIFLDKIVVFDSEVVTDERMDMNDFFIWIIDELNRCVGELQLGTYNATVKERLPVEMRAGTIRRGDYWQYVPKAKTKTLGTLGDDEIAQFIAWYNAHDGQTGYGLQSMNSGRYYDACCLLYDYIGEANPDELTRKERYLRHADRRDSNLRTLDEESDEAFAHWHAQGWFDHAWEMHSLEGMFLRVVKIDGEYYFTFHCSDADRQVRYILELVKNGYPVYADGYGRFVKKIAGEDMIQISSQGCSDLMFHEHGTVQVADYKMLPTDCPDELIHAIQWFEVPEVHLR